MRYFTPELLNRYNSSEPNVASVADKEWAIAEKEYSHHLHRIRKKLPLSVNKFARKLCLWDGEVLGISFNDPYFTPNSARIFLGVEDWISNGDDIVSKERLVILDYILTDMPVFSKYNDTTPTWVENEFHLTETPNIFRHSILLSNCTLDILFTNFSYTKSHVLSKVHFNKFLRQPNP